MKKNLSIILAASIAFFSYSGYSFSKEKADDKKPECSMTNPKDSPTFKGSSNDIPVVTNKEIKSVKKFNKGIAVWKHNYRNGMITLAKFKKGSFICSHKHDTDQISYLLKGRVKIIQGSENKEFIMSAGDVFVLPHGVYHSLTALEYSEMFAVNPGTVSAKSDAFTH